MANGFTDPRNLLPGANVTPSMRPGGTRPMTGARLFSPQTPSAREITGPGAGPGGRRTLNAEQERQAMKNKLRHHHPNLTEKRLDGLVNYGYNKYAGRQAAKMDKVRLKALGKFLAAQSKYQNAQTNFMALMESLKSKRAEIMAAGDQSLWSPYQDQLDASMVRVNAAKARLDGYKKMLGQLQMPAEYMESEVTAVNFLFGLGGIELAEEDEDDLDVEDEEDEPPLRIPEVPPSLAGQR